jgi:hypothetical protein
MLFTYLSMARQSLFPDAHIYDGSTRESKIFDIQFQMDSSNALPPPYSLDPISLAHSVSISGTSLDTASFSCLLDKLDSYTITSSHMGYIVCNLHNGTSIQYLSATYSGGSLKHNEICGAIF